MSSYSSYNHPRPYAQAANGAGKQPNPSPVAPVPGAIPLLPHQGRIFQQGPVRVLCIADVRGNLCSLNTLAERTNANYIIHTGDFGFYDESSLPRIADKTIRHVAQYSPLLDEDTKRGVADVPNKESVKDHFTVQQLPLSQLPDFLAKKVVLKVPVYTVWGACEDVHVLEKFRSGEYIVDNLHIIDELHSRLLEIEDVKIRLLGLGGAVVTHKLFDNGEGRNNIAGGQGTMWTTLLQIGELIDTANRVYDPTETRILVTHASPAREGLLNQLAVSLKSDFSISAGLHFRYGSSWNEFSVNPTLDHYRGKLAASRASFEDIWETVKADVDEAAAKSKAQRRHLDLALEVVNRMPTVANGGSVFGGGAQIIPGAGQVDESAFKNMWNYNLADAAFGYLVLEVEGGRIGTEMRAHGFNFAHRGKPVHPIASPSYSQEHIAQQPQQHIAQQPQLQKQSQGQIQGQHIAQSQPQPPVTSQAQQPLKSPSPATPANVAVLKDKKDVAGGEKPSEPIKSETPKPETTQKDKKPVQPGLFIRGVKDDSEARGLIHADDKPKIINVTRAPSGQYYVVHFDTPDNVQDALNRVAKEHKGGKPSPPGEAPKPHVSVYQSNRASYNNRGGSNYQNFQSGHSGYRSGGASDSETGRGGYRGRGRGGRGNNNGGERGNRSRGRGRGFGEGSNPASPAPLATSTPPADDKAEQ